ncbi:AAA domain-containing protein [Kineococcus xinjiangensis]|uniref:AAA domain-containing protein n=2 Tax=Kineococcus xinjiangensis TaxID=512762 RepID=A0A2S6IHU1_9ACTN|nr:AAA domain-containing protein [Kineococcus xinjiangensis]
MPRVRTATTASPLVEVDDEGRRALRAWADIDRFEMPEVERDDDRGYRATGLLDPAMLDPGAPSTWPPRPRKDPPRGGEHVLGCSIMIGCVPRTQVEDDLDEAFADDLRLREVRRPSTRRGGTAPKLTFRASFAVDASGVPVPESLQYHPIVDFAEFARRRGTTANTEAVVQEGLRLVDERERATQSSWDELLSKSAEEDPRLLVERLVRLLHVSDAPERPRRVRFDSRWVPVGAATEVQPRSFYREDLLAIAQSPTSLAAATYLTGRPGGRPGACRDAGSDARERRQELLEPARLPRAAWPGTYLPRLSQQVALACLLEDEDPVVAVNGPPGTGKTTFLREVYANVLADRAAVMVAFDDPRDAFGAKIDVPMTSGGSRPFFPPDERLCGFEILVASSNNAAVENVSQQVPKLKEVHEPFQSRVSYFRDASDPEKSEDGRDVTRPGLLRKDAPTWGFGAVALGRRALTADFERVAGRYARAEEPGAHLLRLLKDGGSLVDWRHAQQRYTAAVAAVEAWIANLEHHRAAVRVALTTLHEHAEAEQQAELAETGVRSAATAIAEATREVEACEEAARTAADAVTRLKRNRPGLWELLSRTENAQAWRRARDSAKTASTTAETSLQEARSGAEVSAKQEERAQKALSVARARCEELRDSAARCRPVLDRIDPRTFVDDERWWQRPRTDAEQGTAWVTGELHDLQAEVFAAALQVHEQFTRRAGAKVSANLRMWMHLQAGEACKPADAQHALAAWRSFFLVIPLVSTTFASLARLLAGVPAGSLGWLVVDEAGQAPPAHAVGGFSRFRRAVVVGDPQQLEPVVGLPELLVDRLMAAHGAPPELAPTRGSVQRSADAVSRSGTTREEGWVGLPLLVHNRCLEPMFSVSNKMAYDGAMVLGREPKPEREATTVGESRWIDVPRPDGPHFHEADATVVRRLLEDLEWDVEKPATVAVISPFRDVVRGMQRVVDEELRTRLRGATPERVDELCRVGTVHTFQGQERHVVVLVLGGGSRGARRWAAMTPNLLNVAVTRAKDRLVVVGDWSAWHDVGNAEVLADGLRKAPFDG